jgi:hypothetical protein
VVGGGATANLEPAPKRCGRLEEPRPELDIDLNTGESESRTSPGNQIDSEDSGSGG